MNYQECLNHIYSTYMDIKPAIKGKQDSEVRNVDIILSIAHRLDIIPNKDKVIKITGSKGKGTTTRLVESMIRTHYPNKQVAMLISPEEIDHFDRMRINNKAISSEKFAEIYTTLLPELNKKSSTFIGTEYLSPSGLFMLIALTWFKQNTIDYFVLETGRGAQYDEVGNIKSHVSIVTSILLEHPEYMGGTLESIASHKLFVCNNSKYTALGCTAKRFYSNQYNDTLLETVKTPPIDTFPKWYNDNMSLALTGVAKLCNSDANNIFKSFIMANAHTSASFGYKKIHGQHFYYDPAIAVDSLDHDLLKTITNKNETTFVVSLPDEKDIYGLVQALKNYGTVLHITLTGTRGYLSYNITNIEYPQDVIWNGHYSDAIGLAKAISTIKSPTVYLLGTQTYIRLVKQSLFGY